MDYKEAFDSFIKSEFKNTNINTEDEQVAIAFSVRKAWADLYLINIDGISNITQKPEKKENTMKELEGLITQLLNSLYESIDAESFDKLHNKFCHCFMDIIENGIGTDKGFSDYYGKAQKFINMALKYLFCFDIFQSKRALFKYCHMPLDVYTLRWIYRVTGVYINGWSKIDEEVYRQIQKDIRGKVPDNLTLLEYEFEIWANEKTCSFDDDIITINEYNKSKRI